MYIINQNFRGVVFYYISMSCEILKDFIHCSLIYMFAMCTQIDGSETVRFNLLVPLDSCVLSFNSLIHVFYAYAMSTILDGLAHPRSIGLAHSVMYIPDLYLYPIIRMYSCLTVHHSKLTGEMTIPVHGVLL